MKTTFATLAAACIAVAGLAAQSSAPDPAAQSPSSKSSKSMTLTGCLAKGAGDSYALSTTAEPMTMSPNAAPSADNTPDRPKTNWSLVAAGDVNFSALVGHTVEVTGSAVSDKKSADQPVGTSGPNDSMVKKLSVTSIKDLSATCTQ